MEHLNSPCLHLFTLSFLCRLVLVEVAGTRRPCLCPQDCLLPDKRIWPISSDLMTSTLESMVPLLDSTIMVLDLTMDGFNSMADGFDWVARSNFSSSPSLYFASAFSTAGSSRVWDGDHIGLPVR